MTVGGSSDHIFDMPRVRPRSSRTSKRKPSAGTKSSKRPKSLLVLHLDAAKLRKDGLHFEQIADVVGALSVLDGAHVERHDVETFTELEAKLDAFKRAKQTFDVVVIVGHSNDRRIQAAESRFLAWDLFADLLRPLAPRRLLLVACKGGRAAVGQCFFNAIPLLRRIYACPVNATKEFGQLMMFAIPYVLENRTPKSRHVFAAQVAFGLLAGGQLREWKRTTDKGNADTVILDVLADRVNPILKEVSMKLRPLF